MADDRVIQIAVSPGTQEFPDEVYLLYQSGAVFHGSLSEEGWKWNEVSLPQGKVSFPPVSVDSSSRRSDRGKWPVPQFESAGPPWCDLSKHDASSAVRKTRPAKSPATTEESRARRSHWRRL